MTPDELTPEQAFKVTTDPDWLDSNRRYLGTHEDLEGDVDHWQGGDGFQGPKPSKGSPGRDAYMDSLKEVFITEDLINEVVERRRKGVLGKSPTIDVAPLSGDTLQDERSEAPAGSELEEELEGEEPTEAEQLASVLREWWEEQDLTDVLGEACSTLSGEERCVLRLIIDPDRLDESGQLSGFDSPEEALGALRVDVLRRDQAAVHTDLRTRQKTGIVVFEGDRGLYEEDVDYVEKTYVDENGDTVLRIEDDHDDGDPEEGRFDLGGQLFHKQLQAPLLVNESLRSNQAGLNTVRTMINITGQKAGFPELHLVNIEPPEDADGNAQDPERGPAKIQYHVSVPKKAQGPGGQTEERQGTADVVETEPVDNESLREDATIARKSVYRSAHQLHVFMSEDATASGESRVQARADFVQDLEDMAEVLERGGAWICEAAWPLAQQLVGEAPTFIDVDFNCRIDPGPVSPEEQKEIRNALGDGLISLRTAMLMYGIDDPDEEIERIREDQERTKPRIEELREARLESNIQQNEEIARRQREIEEQAAE